jgi:uncharacterized RDD family membrane protein YckC
LNENPDKRFINSVGQGDRVPEESSNTLLRLAAFVVDALVFSLALILPASVVSYSFAWLGGSLKAITLVWWGALLVLILALLFRDGQRGRSMGKRLLGLKIEVKGGGSCGYGRSAIRNLPLIVPGWNLLEVYLVLFARSGLRTGDRLAGTSVSEE